MGRVIPFYIPARHRRQRRLAAPQGRAKVIPFRRPIRKLWEQEWRILGITGNRSPHLKNPGA